MAYDSPTPDEVTPSTVVLRGQDELEYDSNPADGEIVPGMLIEQTATGVAPHSTDGGRTPARFAVENRLFGMHAGTVGADAQEYSTYDNGDMVWEAHFDTGHWAYALLAAGSSVDPKDDAAENRVVSDGSGGFRTFDAAGGDTEQAVVGEAVRSPVDNTAGTEYARFKLRVY